MKLLLIALGIVMILEGIPWFLSPANMRRFMAQLAILPDSTLRFAAFGSMVSGLWLVHLVTG